MLILLTEEGYHLLIQYRANTNHQIESVRSLVLEQQIQFEDEIRNLNEKALDRRIKDLTATIKHRCETCDLCIYVHTYFNNYDRTSLHCSGGRESLLMREYDYAFPFWIGEQQAATFFVYLFNPFRVTSALTAVYIAKLILKVSVVLLLYRYLNKRETSLVPALSKHETRLSLQNRIQAGIPGKLASGLIESGQAYSLDLKQNKPRHLSQSEYRVILVDVLNEAISLWIECSGKDKISLAEDSGLWTVSNDKGTLRTVTLDKYLKIGLIPNRPKVNTVLDTINYVICNTEGNPNLRRSLMEKMRMLDPRYIEQTVTLKM